MEHIMNRLAIVIDRTRSRIKDHLLTSIFKKHTMRLGCSVIINPMPPKTQTTLLSFFDVLYDAIYTHLSIHCIAMEVVQDVRALAPPVLKMGFSRAQDAQVFVTYIHQHYKIGSQCTAGRDPKPYTNNAVYFTLNDTQKFLLAVSPMLARSVQLNMGARYVAPIVTYRTKAHQNVLDIIAAGELVVKTFHREHDLNFILDQIRQPMLHRENYSRYAKSLNRTIPLTRIKMDPSTGVIFSYTRQANKQNTHTKKTSVTLIPPETKQMKLFYSNYIGIGLSYRRCEQKQAYLFVQNAVTDRYFWCRDSPDWTGKNTPHPYTVTLSALQTALKTLNYTAVNTEWVLGLPERYLDVLFVQNNTHQDRLALLAKMYEIKLLFTLQHDIPLWILETAGSSATEVNAPPYGPYNIAAQLNDLLRCKNNSYQDLIDLVIVSALDTLVELQPTLSTHQMQWVVKRLIALNQKYQRPPCEGMDMPKYRAIAQYTQEDAWIKCFPVARNCQPLFPIVELHQWIANNQIDKITDCMRNLTVADVPYVETIYKHVIATSNLKLLEVLLKRKLYVLTQADLVSFLSHPPTEEWRSVVKTYAQDWVSVVLSLPYAQLISICTSKKDLKKIITRESLTDMFTKQQWPWLQDVLRTQQWRSYIVDLIEGGVFSQPLFSMQWLLGCIKQNQWSLFGTILSFMEKQKNLSQFSSVTAQKNFIDLMFPYPDDMEGPVKKYFQLNPIAFTWEDSHGKLAIYYWLDKKENRSYVEKHLSSFINVFKPEVIMELLDHIVPIQPTVFGVLEDALLAALNQQMKDHPSIILMKNKQHLYVLRYFVMREAFNDVTKHLKQYAKLQMREMTTEVKALFDWIKEWTPSAPVKVLSWLNVFFKENKELCMPHIVLFFSMAIQHKNEALLETIFNLKVNHDDRQACWDSLSFLPVEDVQWYIQKYWHTWRENDHYDLALTIFRQNNDALFQFIVRMVKLPEAHIKAWLTVPKMGARLAYYLKNVDPVAIVIDGVCAALLQEYIESQQWDLVLPLWGALSSQSCVTTQMFKKLESCLVLAPAHTDGAEKQKKELMLAFLSHAIEINQPLTEAYYQQYYLQDVDYAACLINSKYKTRIESMFVQTRALLSLPVDVFSLLWSTKTVTLQAINIDYLLSDRPLLISVMSLDKNQRPFLWDKIGLYVQTCRIPAIAMDRIIEALFKYPELLQYQAVKDGLISLKRTKEHLSEVLEQWDRSKHPVSILTDWLLERFLVRYAWSSAITLLEVWEAKAWEEKVNYMMNYILQIKDHTSYLMEAISESSITLSLAVIFLKYFRHNPTIERTILTQRCCQEKTYPVSRLDSYLKSSELHDLENALEVVQKAYFQTSFNAAMMIYQCFQTGRFELIKLAATVINNQCIEHFFDKNTGAIERTRILGKLVFQSRLEKANTVAEVFGILSDFRTLDASCGGCFFQRQGFLKLSLYGHRFDNQEISRTGTEFYKLVKNRLLTLVSQSRITDNEKKQVVHMLSMHRTRFSVFETTSLKIYGFFKTDPEKAQRLLQKEKPTTVGIR